MSRRKLVEDFIAIECEMMVPRHRILLKSGDGGYEFDRHEYCCFACSEYLSTFHDENVCLLWFRPSIFIVIKAKCSFRRPSLQYPNSLSPFKPEPNYLLRIGPRFIKFSESECKFYLVQVPLRNSVDSLDLRSSMAVYRVYGQHVVKPVEQCCDRSPIQILQLISIVQVLHERLSAQRTLGCVTRASPWTELRLAHPESTPLDVATARQPAYLRKALQSLKKKLMRFRLFRDRVQIL